jgi:hypothetical protein
MTSQARIRVEFRNKRSHAISIVVGGLEIEPGVSVMRCVSGLTASAAAGKACY